MSTKAGLLSLAALAGVPYKHRQTANNLYNIASLGTRLVNKIRYKKRPVLRKSYPIRMPRYSRARYGRRYKRRYRRRYGRARPYKRKRITYTPRIVAWPARQGNTKTNGFVTFNTDTENTRTLYWRELTDISKGSEIDDRERDLINIRGFKICMMTWNVSNEPTYFNWAIITPKGCSGLGEGNSVSDSNFFRGYDDTRELDFSPSLSAIQFHCNAINSDVWTVLKHKRHILGEDTTGTFTLRNRYPNAKLIMRYFKMNRSVRYNDGRCTTPVFWVWWYDKINANGGALAEPDLRAQWRRITYFREPT